MEKKYINLREILIGIMFVLLLAIVGARAVQVQIYDGPWLSKKASNQYEKSFTNNGRRGTIYDRNFREMAVSIEVTSIAAYPMQITDVNATAEALAKALKMKAKPVLQKLKELREVDKNIYLRAGSINLVNGLVGLNFSCDGSHYLPVEEFFSRDARFWF